MPKKTIKTFKLEYLQILDENGRCDKKLMPKLSAVQIKELYRSMVLVRTFDNKAVALQRQGRIGTYAQVKGQEAVQVGTCFALKKTDWVLPSYRESAVFLLRGHPMYKILQYWAGDERGSVVAADNNTMPIVIPVGSQIALATGVAWAMKLKREKGKAALVYFGDGATSKADFHEGLNLAGVFQVPCVFLCSNNQYAISVPGFKQTAAETYAQKGIAYGVPCLKVDGNDIFAVYKATKEALDRAYAGKGPTLIECYTYRMGDHTTSDDARRYRTEKELQYWQKRDPLDRLRKYMESKKMWGKKDDEKLLKEVSEIVEKGVAEMEKISAPDMEDMFKYTYAEMTAQLKDQMNYLKEALK